MAEFNFIDKVNLQYILGKLKTIFDTKQDSLSAQTPYTNKGTATKVPQITTNVLGQVTNITEKEIDWEGTYAEYQALPDTKLTDGRTYYVKDFPSNNVNVIDDIATTSTTKTWSTNKLNNNNEFLQQQITTINNSLTNYLKTKRVQVNPTPNAYITPFSHYANFDYSQYGIAKDKIISIMVESTSTGSAVAYLGAGTSIHVHANTNETRYVTIVYLGN